jgi:hypothetical protein
MRRDGPRFEFTHFRLDHSWVMEFRFAASVQTLRSAERLFAVGAPPEPIAHTVAFRCFQTLRSGESWVRLGSKIRGVSVLDSAFRSKSLRRAIPITSEQNFVSVGVILYGQIAPRRRNSAGLLRERGRTQKSRVESHRNPDESHTYIKIGVPKPFGAPEEAYEHLDWVCGGQVVEAL